MSLLKSVGDFFYSLSGESNSANNATTSSEERYETSSSARPKIQAVTMNAGADNYRSFTEIGRQVAANLNYTVDLETAAIYDSADKKIADNIELLSLAMIDLEMITKSSSAASPSINWSKVALSDPEGTAQRLRDQLATYRGNHWQDLPSVSVVNGWFKSY